MALLSASGPVSALELGVDGTSFTVNGQPRFLVGISYYGGLGAPEEFVVRDLDDLKLRGFNWIRVWATWAAHENNVSAVSATGEAREPFLTRLKWLIEQADKRGIIVDVTLSRLDGAVATEPLLTSQEVHLRDVELLARELKPYRNVYIDISNERNIRDKRFTSFEDLKALRDRIKQVDPQRLVTASHAGDETREDVEAYVVKCGLDILSLHRPRNAKSPWQTAEVVQQYLTWMREMGRVVPVHHQEPFRRDFSQWQPKAVDFLVDARQAREGGAAGWCLHNGSLPGGDKGPRRSFDMRAEYGRLFDQLDAEERYVTDHVALIATGSTKTWISLHDKRWHLDGRMTYPGAKAEGLLMNVRMVNSIFEDRNDETRPKGFDANANTDAFVAQIPDYTAHGIRAFTIFLQGGMPGYEKALNSAFEPDGSLRPDYLKRAERVIRAADEAGAAVILGCYYQRQDQILRDTDAVRAGVVNVAKWVVENGFANVMLDLANEYPHNGFDHKILKTPDGIAELIGLARKTTPALLVSASGIGNGRCDKEVCEAADFVLIHFNGVPVEQIPSCIAALKGYGKAIVCNEDDKVGEAGARAAEASVANGCSWGLMLSAVNQYFPLEFKGHGDDPVIYGKLKELTGA